MKHWNKVHLRTIHYLLLRVLTRIKNILRITAILWSKKSKNSRLVASNFRYLVINNFLYQQAFVTSYISLLRHADGLKVCAYVDEAISRSLKRESILLPIKKSLELIQITESDWRKAKLEIILDMGGTHDVFVDADTQFHEAPPQIHGVQVLVNEGNKLTSSPYRSVLQEILGVQSKKVIYMLNTSIFSWGGILISDEDKNQIRRIFIALDSKLENIGKTRLAEQLALSAFVQLNELTFHAWKLTDGLMDGILVDSTYLGNTGRVF